MGSQEQVTVVEILVKYGTATECTRVAGRAISNGQITRRNRVMGDVLPLK